MICPFCKAECIKLSHFINDFYQCLSVLNITNPHLYLYDKRSPFMSDYRFHEKLEVPNEFIIFNDSNLYSKVTINDEIFEGTKSIPTHFKTAEEIKNYLLI